MKRNALIFGLISGLLVTCMMLYTVTKITSGKPVDGNDVLGYAAMIVAFSFIFVGIKNYRDKYNHGVITFGKALKVGLLITLVASSLYVVVWVICYYLFVPDFMDKYTICVMNDAKRDGATQVELTQKAAEMAKFSEWYKNPVFVVVITFLEIFPVGLLVSLIAALILKRKSGREEQLQGL